MRVAFKMRLKPGCEAVYKEKHDAIWPELAEQIRRSGVRNYSIFREGPDLFAYLETDEPPAMDGEVAPIVREWWLMMEPYMEYDDAHRPRMWPMEEMFHLD